MSLCVKWKEWKSRFVADMEMCCPDLLLGSTCGPATGTAFKICLSCRNDNPPQYSCLENPMDGGAWQATVHGVAKSQTRLTTEFPHLDPTFSPVLCIQWLSSVCAGCIKDSHLAPLEITFIASLNVMVSLSHCFRSPTRLAEVFPDLCSNSVFLSVQLCFFLQIFLHFMAFDP